MSEKKSERLQEIAELLNKIKKSHLGAVSNCRSREDVLESYADWNELYDLLQGLKIESKTNPTYE